MSNRGSRKFVSFNSRSGIWPNLKEAFGTHA
jgi:hypothetical protein